MTKSLIESAGQSQTIVIERLRGLVRLEEGDLEQDYQLTVTYNEVSLKPMKNQKNRLDERDYGFLAYGRNLGLETVKEVLKTIRSQ